MAAKFGIMVSTGEGVGILHQLTGVIAKRGGNITSVEILAEVAGEARTFFEIDEVEDAEGLFEELKALEIVMDAALVKTLDGQVAVGAVSEADRHNIRGERISVDTIPLVGETQLADAVRAVARLPRACAIVLAGSLMGGEIEKAVREVRAQGLLVVSLNMAGSVPDAADLVVTDPVQAGVMTVMAVASTAKFTISQLKRRVF
jgi:energy-converting hydrogenase B subunit Q